MSMQARSVRTRFIAGAGWWLAATVIACAAGAPVAGAPCWSPPVVGTIADGYREPPCRWCAGNRGIEYRIGTNAAVQAAASGRVVFVGTVVDVQYVVIQLPSGWRHTYGQLTSTTLELGDVVLATQAIGHASQTFHFGLRIGTDYADPTPFIGILRGRRRLLPIDGTAARPAPPARPICGPTSDGGSRG